MRRCTKKASGKLLGFLRWFASWFRIFRPHFWHVRARRRQVQVELQKLLPAPYDPYGIELAYRSDSREVSIHSDAPGDAIWDGIIDRLDAKVGEQRLAQVGAFEAGAHAAYDVGSAFHAIDQDYYKGVALSAEKAVDSLSDLSARFEPHSLSEQLRTAYYGVAKGTISDLQGHVGEAVVERHLQEAGIDAHLAPDPSQQAWDINIEGHQVQVKTLTDAGSLSSHFSKYSNTPVLVSGDAQHLPADAIHFDSATGEGFDHVRHALNAGEKHLVLADHALSSGAVHDQAQHATGLIAGDSHIFDGHIEGHHTFGHLPYVTLALSGFREFSLLLGGKTDLLGAAKNLGLDAGGTGVGGAVGVKLGAIIGSLILPGFGTAAGGIVGGYFGARHGRHFTSDIKQKAYREAAAVYETHLREFEQTALGLESEAAAEFQAAKSSEQSRLTQHAAQTSQNIVQTKDALDSWLAYDSLVQPDAALPLLDAGSAEIASLKSAIEARYRASSWWKKFVWPDVEVLAHQEALAFLKGVAAQFRALRMKVEKGNPLDRSHVMFLLGRTGILRSQLEAELTRIYAVRRARDQQAHDYIEAVCTELLNERRKTEGSLLATINSLKERIRNALQPLVAKLTHSSERLRTEAGKLGMNLDAVS